MRDTDFQCPVRLVAGLPSHGSNASSTLAPGTKICRSGNSSGRETGETTGGGNEFQWRCRLVWSRTLGFQPKNRGSNPLNATKFKLSDSNRLVDHHPVYTTAPPTGGTMRVNCKVCGIEFYAKPNRVKKGIAKTCSIKCRGFSKRSKVLTSCSLCKKEFERQLCKLHQKNWCSRACKEKDQCIGGPLALPHYGNGQASYRERAFRYHGKVCNRCGYSEHEQMLDVHHVDRNRKHNKISNLKVLCVWCHALHTRGIIGRVAHLGERRTCNAEAAGAEPVSSTNFKGE